MFINNTLCRKKERIKRCNKCRVPLEAGRNWRKTGAANRHYECNSCWATYSRELKYGISYEGVKQLLSSQNNKCPICQANVTIKDHLDHDHATGTVRGILDRSCNLALGLFRDNPAFLQNAIVYLRGGE